MYTLADPTEPRPAAAAATDDDAIERELREIEEFRDRALANRDALFCSPAMRHLVETEIPRLIDIIRRLRGDQDAGRPGTPSERWMLGALAELRREMEAVRLLAEMR